MEEVEKVGCDDSINGDFRLLIP